jgi:hypothetical protein
MKDRGTITGDPTGPNGEVPLQEPSQTMPEALEERVRRLEDTVAMLQDTRHLEERVVERLASRLNRSASPLGSETTGITVNAGRQFLPVALEPVAESSAASPTSGLRHPWLLLDFYQELQSIVRMFFDRRYRVARMARIVPIAALALFLFSWFFIDSMRLIGPILDKMLDVVLICIVYKVLSREAQRYRQAVASLPPVHQN